MLVGVGGHGHGGNLGHDGGDRGIGRGRVVAVVLVAVMQQLL